MTFLSMECSQKSSGSSTQGDQWLTQQMLYQEQYQLKTTWIVKMKTTQDYGVTVKNQALVAWYYVTMKSVL